MHTIAHLRDSLGRYLYRVQTAAGTRHHTSAEPLSEAQILAAVGIEAAAPAALVAAPPPAPLPSNQAIDWSPPDPLWIAPQVAAPEVSVIIRAYNPVLEWLREAVNSALASTLRGIEVIVVDDGSEPPVHPVSGDPRCGHLRLPYNTGLAAARNAGVERARGKYIRLLDADDLLPEGALAAQAAYLRQTTRLAVFGRLELFGDEALCAASRDDGDWPQHQLIDRLLATRADLGAAILDERLTVVPANGAMFRRECFVPVPEDFQRSEDNAAVKLLIEADEDATIGFDDCTVVRYRLSPGQMSPGTDDARRGLIDRVRERTLANVQNLMVHEELIREVCSPLNLGIIDWRLEAGGATWHLMQLAQHMDRRLICPRFLNAEDGPGSQWCRRNGVAYEVLGGGSEEHFSARVASYAKGFLRALDACWACHLISDDAVAAVQGNAFAHAQSVHLHWNQMEAGHPEVYGRFKRIFSVSQDVLDAHPHLQERGVVVWSPVDVQRIRAAQHYRALVRQSLGIGQDEVVAVWSGRLRAQPEKRTDLLEEVGRRLAADGRRVRLLVLGHVARHLRGADELIAKWSQWAADTGHIWVDGLFPWQTPPYYAAGDVMFSCSDIEGLSLALLEGMAAGLMPIVTDISGVREAVDAQYGTIVRPGDTDEMLAELLAWADDPAAIRERGKLAAHVVSCLFDVRVAAREHALIYHGRELAR